MGNTPTRRGHLTPPDAEVTALRDGTPVRRDRVSPRLAPWLRRLPRSLRRRLGLGGEHFQAGDTELVSIAGDRAMLHVVEGMRGEVRIGVARMGTEQILRDPSLRTGGGAARYPLPYGASARIEWKGLTYLVRTVPG